MNKPTDALRKHPWLAPAARAGFAAKGVIYGLIGGLAIAQVVDSSGRVGGGRTAVKTIGDQPFGQFLLVAIGVGLFAYALWRFVQAGFDPEGSGTDAGGILKRIGRAMSGGVHVLLGVTAIQMATGGGGGESRKSYLAELMSTETVGPYLVIALGVFVIGFAAYELRKGLARKFERVLDYGKMPGPLQSWMPTLGRVALTARAVVLAMVGVYLVRAGLTVDPGQYKGVGGVLREIGTQTFGAILLVLTAAGLAAYGAFQVLMARYRHLPRTP